MIRKLHVVNYRCLTDFTFEPGARNLLLGANGSGKSSVLDVLGAVQDVVAFNDEVGQAFPDHTVGTAGHDRQFVEITLEAPMGVVRYTAKVHRRNRLHYERLLVGEDEVYRAGGGDVRIRTRSGAVQQANIAPSRSFLASLDLGAADPSVAWFRSFIQNMWILRPNPASMDAAGRTDDAVLARTGANFPAWCRRFVDTARTVIDDALGPLKEVVTGLRDLQVRTAGRVRVLVAVMEHPDGSTYDLDFDQLSDGQKILVLLYVLLAAAPGRASLVALDEPDNWVSLREIQPFLRELLDVTEDHHLQTVIASHSAEVIDYLGETDARWFERTDQGVLVRAPGHDPLLRLSERLARGWDAAQ